MEHQTVSLPRVMVAAPASSSGKTSLTCALLQAALNRGVDPCAFKCGPDYIDPLFHREVLSLPSRNLDLFFSDEPTVRGLMAVPVRAMAWPFWRAAWAFMMESPERNGPAAGTWPGLRIRRSFSPSFQGAPPSHWLLFCRGCGHSGRPT